MASTDVYELEDRGLDATLRRRSQGRELALKLLYLLDMRGREETDAELERVIEWEGLGAESNDFACRLYAGVAERVSELDEGIKAAADNWELSRMAYIDRALLRLGAWELLYCPDIPPKVTISEALDLAKKYSTEKSSAFVNGVLDRIFQVFCPDKV